MIRKTNILKELSNVNPLINEETNFQTILELVSSKSENNNNFDFDKLDKDRIFHLDSIKKPVLTLDYVFRSQIFQKFTTKRGFF